MKKLIALVLALILALSLAACTDGDHTPNVDTTESPTNLLQGDGGSVHAEDDNRALEQIFGQNISVNIWATNVYVLNIDTNSVLYQKNSDEPIAPASTAKMLTALTVLDYCSLDDTFIVGTEIDLISSDSSRAWLNNGDKLTVKQLLVALLLPSGNDAAYTLAVNTGRIIAGNDRLNSKQAIEVFVDAMNQKAEEVGAVSSHFANPDGYDEDGQYTTAFDLAQIAKACLENDVLATIMGSYKVSDSWGNGREVTYHNTNELINPDSPYYYSAAVGLKTGSTGDAGSCLVSAAKIEGQTYICVVMGSSADIRYLDSLTVFSAIDPNISLLQENTSHPQEAIPSNAADPNISHPQEGIVAPASHPPVVQSATE